MPDCVPVVGDSAASQRQAPAKWQMSTDVLWDSRGPILGGLAVDYTGDSTQDTVVGTGATFPPSDS